MLKFCKCFLEREILLRWKFSIKRVGKEFVYYGVFELVNYCYRSNISNEVIYLKFIKGSKYCKNRDSCIFLVYRVKNYDFF